MKRLITLFLAMALTSSTMAQKVAYNEKAPSLEVEKYLFGEAQTSPKPLYIDFFVYGADQNRKEVAALNKIAKKYHSKIDFLIISKENNPAVIHFFSTFAPLYFSVAHDPKGVNYTNYGVRYIPFSVILDRRGRFAWQGRNSLITDEIISRFLK